MKATTICSALSICCAFTSPRMEIPAYATVAEINDAYSDFDGRGGESLCSATGGQTMPISRVLDDCKRGEGKEEDEAATTFD
ncbi:hypothetical protein QVD17_06325 [Tagetes erecta]|uniref:Uncharacterized protein n=1 Tax=Tagetes erecta TaxID=13708 RepID=A0AAD8LFF0_TARER|nr:hypothetical protein QVD17_06325 [Tagetes erecta]